MWKIGAHIIRSSVYGSVFVLHLLFCQFAAAQSTQVYQDDFEGTVTGWSVTNTDFDPDVTQFLGRFDNSPNSTSRTFALPASTDRVEISFDFYRFDSWDNNAQYGFDRFEIEIGGNEIFSLPFSSSQAARSGITGNVTWSHSPLGPTSELAFGTGQWWFDQLHRVDITVNNPSATLELTLRTDLNQGGNDESGGFDNMTITAFPVMPDITANKSVEIIDTNYALPGNLAEYTISILNTGGAADADSLSFIDILPPNTALFTGDLDGAGNPIIFTDNSVPSSGITCCTAAHIEYSDSTSSTPVFGYAPQIPFDPAITHVRVTPSGTLRDGQVDPVDFNFKLRTRIN